MTEFTASNGIRIVQNGFDPLQYTILDADGDDMLKALPVLHEFWEIPALREFFQDERDRELGRWRWPENPDYVVYVGGFRGDGGFRVLKENTGDTWTYFFDAIDDERYTADAWRAARAYRDAHPEPKPWHDAKPGEVWVLSLNLGTEYDDVVFSVKGDRFHTVTPCPLESCGITAPAITAGRRIWPTEAER